MIKRNIFIALIIGFIAISCEKEENSETDDNQDKGIAGEWVWLKSYGGNTGTDIQTPEQSGIQKTVKFHENDTVEIFEDGELIHKTDYFLSREESSLLHETFDFLTINYKYQMTNPDSIITISMRYMILGASDTLTLDEDVYDGYEHLYKRK